MSPLSRAVIGVLSLAAAVALFVVLRDDDDSHTAGGSATTAATTRTTTGAQSGNGGEAEAEKPKRPEQPGPAKIEVEGGAPVGGVAELSFAEGERIRFVVESDVADHVHLHGYDVFEDVAAGGRAKFDVPATIVGVFEVELEDRVVPIAEITVEPS